MKKIMAVILIWAGGASALPAFGAGAVREPAYRERFKHLHFDAGTAWVHVEPLLRRAGLEDAAIASLKSAQPGDIVNGQNVQTVLLLDKESRLHTQADLLTDGKTHFGFRPLLGRAESVKMVYIASTDNDGRLASADDFFNPDPNRPTMRAFLGLQQTASDVQEARQRGSLSGDNADELIAVFFARLATQFDVGSRESAIEWSRLH